MHRIALFAYGLWVIYYLLIPKVIFTEKGQQLFQLTVIQDQLKKYIFKI